MVPAHTHAWDVFPKGAENPLKVGHLIFLQRELCGKRVNKIAADHNKRGRGGHAVYVRHGPFGKRKLLGVGCADVKLRRGVLRHTVVDPPEAQRLEPAHPPELLHRWEQPKLGVSKLHKGERAAPATIAAGRATGEPGVHAAGNASGKAVGGLCHIRRYCLRRYEDTSLRRYEDTKILHVP